MLEPMVKWLKRLSRYIFFFLIVSPLIRLNNNCNYVLVSCLPLSKEVIHTERHSDIWTSSWKFGYNVCALLHTDGDLSYHILAGTLISFPTLSVNSIESGSITAWASNIWSDLCCTMWHKRLWLMLVSISWWCHSLVTGVFFFSLIQLVFEMLCCANVI